MYWILVILWQTVRPVANRSLLDIVIKIGLFFVVAIYAVNHCNIKKSGYVFLWSLLFFTSQIITVGLDETITASTIITVLFMLAQITIFLMMLFNEQISKEDIRWFGEFLVLVVLIMAIYNVLFDFNTFIRVFRLSFGAYGSECSSFLYSNHEFALYLATAIIFLIWNLFQSSNGKFKKIIIILFLFLNLLSTYSRTAIIGCLVALLILGLFFNIKFFIGLSVSLFSILIVAFNNSVIYDFIFNKMLKGSYEQTGGILDEGRANMYQHEWDFFKSSTLFQKIFGKGYIGGSDGGHDAYLYILNIGGIVMFFFFAAVIIFAIYKSFCCLKTDKKLGSLCLSLQAFSLVYMIAQTPILFFSTMDSYFITVLTIIIPLYISNHLREISV